MKRIFHISTWFACYMFLWGIADAWAQCPMCKAGVESNSRMSDDPLAATLNNGILFLLSLPFLGVLIIGGVWYWKSRNAPPEDEDKSEG